MPDQPRKVNLLIDIQNSIKEQNSTGYVQWPKIFNLKTASSTLIFLQENGLDDIDKLNEKAQAVKDKYNGINTRIQNIDVRLKDISALKKTYWDLQQDPRRMTRLLIVLPLFYQIRF